MIFFNTVPQWKWKKAACCWHKNIQNKDKKNKDAFIKNMVAS